MSFKSGKSRDSALDATDACQAALLGLNESVVANRDLIMANREWSERQFAEVNEKLDRLMAHLKVPPKPPAGFVKE